MSNSIEAMNTEAIKASYFNLLAVLLEQESIKPAHVQCLLKWGIQLDVSIADLEIIGKGLHGNKFVFPDTDIKRLESVYHLVHMIYLDRIVEDTELEVASIYATRLGFKDSLVGDLFKSIATAEFDLSSPEEVRRGVIDFLKF